MTPKRIPGIVRYVHRRGTLPCKGLAFVGPVGCLEGRRRPIAFASGGIAIPVFGATVPCGWCGSSVGVDDLAIEAYTLPQVYYAPRGRGRPLTALTENESIDPVSIGAIARATGIPIQRLRSMCEAGEVAGAYRHSGKRREWRISPLDANRWIARISGKDKGVL